MGNWRNALAALALAACGVARHAPDAGLVDAGSPAGASTPMRAMDAANMSRVLTYPRSHRGQRSAERTRKLAAKPTDSRTAACVAKHFELWDDLEACLKGAPTSAPDAGVHRLGDFVPPPTVNPSWSIPNWYVNASTGNDHNTCVDSAHPCKTHARIVDRWGTSCPALTTVVQETLLNDLPSTDQIQVCTPQETGGTLNIVGTLTTVATGSLSGVVAKNRATSQALNANLGASAASYVGLEIVNSTHSSVAWVDSIVSGTVALITQPLVPGTLTSSIPGTEVNTWANGDSFTILRPSKVTFQGSEPTFQDFSTNAFTAWKVDVQDNGTGLSFLSWTNAVLEESKLDIDANAFNGLFTNVLMSPNQAGGGVFCGASTASTGGCLYDAGAITNLLGGQGLDSEAFDSDVVNDTIIRNIHVFNELAYDFIDVPSGQIEISQGAQMIDGVGGSGAGPAMIYGGPTIDVSQGGTLIFPSTAASNLPGATLQIDGVAKGMAVDMSLDQVIQHPGRTLSLANLDATIASGGFAGVAYSEISTPAYRYDTLTWPTPATYLNAGANITITPNSPGTGQVTIAASSGASCPIDLASCVTNTLAVSHGGTGVATCTGAMVGNGTSAITCSSPLSVANGGTSSTTLTAHDLVVGNGTSAVNFLAPGAGGNFARSNGTDWFSSTLPAWFYSQGSGTAANPCNSTTFGGVTVVVPSTGAIVDVTATMTAVSPGTVCTLTWGIAVDNTACSFSVSTGVSTDANIGDLFGSALTYENSYSAGSHTFDIQAGAGGGSGCSTITVNDSHITVVAH